MNEGRQLRLVMQALGMYCIVNAVFSICRVISQLVTSRFSTLSGFTSDTMRPFLVESCIYGMLLFVTGWVLLAKAEPLAQMVAGMSARNISTEPEA